MERRSRTRVAVIGGGPAGLWAARHILSRPEAFDPPVVYEMTDHLGGTWFYEERVGTYDNGYPIHSSMYRDLRTNLPKEIMMFPDFPFDDRLNSFLHHTSVQQYLEKYCEKHDIARHIKFSTVVEKVKPVSMETETGGAVTWEVISRSTRGDQNTQTFDSVFVCNGHYSDPHLPCIPGIEHFKGKVLHSHSYRYPEPFANKSVVVLGARASGVDISIELAQVNAQVILSPNTPTMSLPPPLGIRQASAVVGVLEDGSLQFQDGSVTQADILLFCTGYNFNFPFLCPSELGLDVQDLFVTPLYKYLLPPGFPSIFFFGICKIICPFIHFDCQVKFALAVLEGSVKLPTQEEMEKEVQREMQRKQDIGVQVKHLLNLDKDQWDYYLDLARVGRFTPPQPVFESLYEEVRRQRQKDPQKYRQINYRLIDATQWELLEAPPEQTDRV
ncbi:flavin-containing monooxygenase FMO GS-OX-like 2 [Sinocyclocheilus anshuiensis]|uniref:flavin-containing monooxygenase FMO GS-OX-like 2 n=1 Tax=Sinocyclocheilus anshuiensis TaxID=1608454 RepID=UPI0007B928F8|nr:PREDICTED: flavin-containing monooxygenase FMO GS-OX-like 2 [Sinocyclocheilus anshuiensis]